MRVVAVLLLFVICHVLSEPLWGQTGHCVTALVAQKLLSTAATNEVYDLIPSQNGQLYLVANWADQIRSQPAYKWTSPLHFADTPDWACVYKTTDCEHDACVVTAIANYTTRQVQGNLPLTQKVDALKFFVHFVGDIHQPLHVGFIGNLGGNKLTGKFLGKTTNLHSLWDSAIIDKVMKDRFNNDQNQLAAYLLNRVQNGDWKSKVAQWKSCSPPQANSTEARIGASYGSCPEVWADESAKLACDYAYVQADGKTPVPNNFNLGQDYYDRNLEIVFIQLAKAGVRMAAVLNNLYPGAVPQEAPAALF